MSALVVVLALASGCAPARVSLRELRDYDQAIQLAEKQGIDTTAQHAKLVEMIVSYLKRPGVDPEVRAMRAQAAAQTMMMLDSPPLPTSRPMPMSPNEYRHAVWGR